MIASVGKFIHQDGSCQNPRTSRRLVDSLRKSSTRDALMQPTSSSKQILSSWIPSGDSVRSRRFERSDWNDACWIPRLALDHRRTVAAGDKVVSRSTWAGTHQGVFLGIPATNKTVTVPGVVIDRLSAGKINEGPFNALPCLPFDSSCCSTTWKECNRSAVFSLRP